ncbi:MAG TPA: lipid-binding SYLF domain-containing protein, partial [Terriglobia bacterium]|nr:lipid-binding SYLF domain-containing protein [Terriglobia bacterium]
MRYLVIAALMLSLPAEFLQAKEDKISERLGNAAVVLYEIMQTPDNSIPKDLLDKSVCVGIIPGEKKVAFVVGGNYGRGTIVCRRDGDGPWGAPSMIAVHGGSFGFQWGGTETDVVVVVMNPSGIRRLLKSKGELGADVSVAAGPVGRTAAASTDLMMTAEILTYSRSRGLFAGISLKGAAVTPDREANARLYGHFVDPEDLLIEGKGEIPSPAQPLINELAKYSPRGGTPFAPIQAPKQGTAPPP